MGYTPVAFRKLIKHMLAFCRMVFLLVTILPLSRSLAFNGFSLPDSATAVTLQYDTRENLIVLPVVVNHSRILHLILDTGARNIVVFGNTFENIIDVLPESKITFSGLGSGKPVNGKMSIHNVVRMQTITGTDMPIVVVTDKNLFTRFPEIDGIIGLDLFQKFQIEIIPAQHLIVFRRSLIDVIPEGYQKIAMRIDDTRPLFSSTVHFKDGTSTDIEVMIDTGSALGFLLKTPASGNRSHKTIGVGLNGNLYGREDFIMQLTAGEFSIQNIPASIVHSPWHHYGSIGMGILKDYDVLIDYNAGYVCLRKHTSIAMD